MIGSQDDLSIDDTENKRLLDCLTEHVISQWLQQERPWLVQFQRGHLAHADSSLFKVTQIHAFTYKFLPQEMQSLIILCQYLTEHLATKTHITQELLVLALHIIDKPTSCVDDIADTLPISQETYHILESLHFPQPKLFTHATNEMLQHLLQIHLYPWLSEIDIILPSFFYGKPAVRVGAAA